MNTHNEQETNLFMAALYRQEAAKTPYANWARTLRQWANKRIDAAGRQFDLFGESK